MITKFVDFILGTNFSKKETPVAAPVVVTPEPVVAPTVEEKNTKRRAKTEKLIEKKTVAPKAPKKTATTKKTTTKKAPK